MADSTPMNVNVQNGKVTIEGGEIIVTGGATEAKQDAEILVLDDIKTAVEGTLSVTFTNTTIDVDVKNKPDVSVPDGVDVNNFPSGFNVNNFPATQPISLADGVQLDSFGRLRVSNPYTLMDNMFNTGLKIDTMVSLTNGTGTVTHLPYENSVVLAAPALNDYAIIQTRRVGIYQPGKSLSVKMTVLPISANDPNITTYTGYYDEGAVKTAEPVANRIGNGYMLRMVGTSASFISRSSVSAQPQTDTVIAQTSWNVDPMNGTGASGITLDFTKSQILFIDMQYLGVGRIRMGFVVNGISYVAHQFLNTNVLSSVYMTTPNLPIRWEIRNTGGASAVTMKAICCEVASGGSFNPRGEIHAWNMYNTAGTNTRAISTTWSPLISIRLNENYRRYVVNLLNLKIASPAIIRCVYKVLFNATLTGATFANTPVSVNGTTNSIVDIDTAATVVSGGTELESNFFISSQGQEITPFENKIMLGCDVAGNSDVITIAVRTTTGNDDASVALQWQEWR